jgi:hypothetical protein
MRQTDFGVNDAIGSDCKLDNSAMNSAKSRSARFALILAKVISFAKYSSRPSGHTVHHTAPISSLSPDNVQARLFVSRKRMQSIPSSEKSGDSLPWCLCAINFELILFNI